MAPEDRDRQFEKALARHLRSAASSSASANTAGEARAESCPDPEILAAYHDRSLSLSELNSWKQHIAACERCQLLLAHVEATENIPADVEADKSVLVIGSPVLASRAAAASPPTAEKVSSLLATPRSVAQKSVASPAAEIPHRRAQWRWLVPAGALAAGLLVWIAFHESRNSHSVQAPPVEEAQNRQQATLPPSLQPSAPPVAKADKEQAPASRTRAVPAQKDAEKVVPQKQSQLDQTAALTARDENAPALKKKEQEGKEERTVSAEVQARDQAKAPASEANGLRENNRDVAVTKSEPAPAPAPPQPGFLPSGTSNADTSTQSPKPSQSQVTAQSETVGGAVSAYDNKASRARQSLQPMHLAKAQVSAVFGFPGGKVLWRVGSGGLIQTSTDNGATWNTQPSGVTSDLLGGSAPAAKVCWIVGSSGTILRTTDGGAHWTKITSPVSSDLRSIEALDALHATLRDPATNQSFRTVDGGETWTPISNQ